MGAVKQKAQTIISAQPQREVRVIHHPLQQPENVKLPMAAYIRVSTDMDDQLNSFATQVRHYREYISQNDDWELVDLYADEGITGTSTRKRDEFHRLMRDCRKGRIKRVLVKSISRFARNTEDCIEAVRELTSLGVSILFEKEGIDSAKMTGELFLAAMSDFAQNESLSMAGNLRRGIRMRMANGTYIPTAAPFGYRWEGDTLVIQPDEAKTVRWIYMQFLSGSGPDNIALELTRRAVACKKGQTNWSVNAVRYILSNERYVGDMLLQKSYHSDTLPFRKIYNHGQIDRYLVEGCHVPIIDREAYDRVQKRLEERRLGKEKARHGTHPFHGKLRCGECGGIYRVKVASGKRYWTCRRHDRDASLCGGPRILETDLERVWVRCYNKLKLHCGRIIAPMLDQLYTLRRCLSFNNPEVMRIGDEIMALSEQNAVFAGLAARGIWDTVTYQQKKAENEQRIQRLSAEKAKLWDNETLETMIEQTRMLQGVITDGPGASTDFLPEMFTAMVSHIIVSAPKRLQIHLVNSLALDDAFGEDVSS